MLKRFSCALLVMSLATPTMAELCTIDAVPAATLLLPYFEVNLGKRSKAEETLISIQNADAAPTIAHVVFWTDLSLPTLAFDVFLTGYDVEEISLLDLFFRGRLPGSVDNIVGFTFLDELQAAHAGREVDGQCYGQRLSGNVARGYVTIDNANAGTTADPLFPNDAGYFTSGTISSSNQLWGVSYTFTKKYIEQENLVSIEAGDVSSEGTGFTFYRRYDEQGNDQREPLATTWGARWFRGSTHLIVWRDSLVDNQPFPCGDPESTGGYPLDTIQLVIFDDQEDATEILDELPFPAETQSVKVGGSTLPTFGYEQGWIYLNLNLPPDLIAQSLVLVRQDLRKRRSRAMAMFFTHAADAVNGVESEALRRGRR